MRSCAVLFLSLYVLRALVAEVNSALSGAHIWLFAGGLFVTYSALMFPFRQGLPVSVLAGLLCDSVSPVPFGTHGGLFAAAHVGIYNLRERLQRDETVVRVAVALILNLALFLALFLVREHGHRVAARALGPGVVRSRRGARSSLVLRAPSRLAAVGACDSRAFGVGFPPYAWPSPTKSQAASSSPGTGSTPGYSRSTG
jgi:cell shape-determining protein MreD